MSGPTRLLDSIGGEVVFEIFAFVAIVVALMNMFLVGRHTRADEETGRAELLRSARVGRRAPLAAALGLAGLANLAVGLLVFAAAAGTGLPVGRVGPVRRRGRRRRPHLRRAHRGRGAGVREHPGRLRRGRPDHRRGVRAARRRRRRQRGAVVASPRSAGASARSRTSDNRWWPLLIPVAVTALLVAVGAWRCWIGATSAPGWCRPGPAGRPRRAALGSPLGLAWRLQRGSLAGWAVGLFLLGAAYGSFGDSIEQYVAGQPRGRRLPPRRRGRHRRLVPGADHRDRWR